MQRTLLELSFLPVAYIPAMVFHAVADLPLFEGLNKEQVNQLAGACSVREFESGTQVFAQNDEGNEMFILLSGRIHVSVGHPPVQVGTVDKGETLGELSLLSSQPRSATAITDTKVETAVLTHRDLGSLVRRRPDIGVIIYRNLGLGLGRKLLRSDQSFRDQALAETSFLQMTRVANSREQ